MTEAEWLTCSDPDPMLHCLCEHFPEMQWTERKPRLLIYAFMEAVQNRLPRECRDLIKLIEKEADDGVRSEELETAFDEADRSGGEPGLIFAIGYLDLGLACYEASRILASSVGVEGTEQFEMGRRTETRRQADCVREIFGNPFHPFSFGPAWPTPAATQLAKMIYEQRAFDRMPELADALENAGCTNSDILEHCRRAEPHVRGCWVIDLILGKE